MPRFHEQWNLLFDSDSEDEERDAGAFIVLGALQADRLRRLRRSATRQYLTRPQLLPDPRENTSWTRLYEHGDDRAYITCMGFNRAGFEYILNNGYADAWNSNTIPRPDTSAHGAPRLGRRSLDAAGALGLALHYLCSCVDDTDISLIFAIIPTTISRYISWSLKILLDILREMPEAQIPWPDEDDCAEYSILIEQKYSLLGGGIGFCDGLKIRVTVSDDPDIENATYNGWLHAHFESCVFVFSPRGIIIGAVINVPGSWHDSNVARPIFEKLLYETPAGYFLIADTAFPRGDRRIAGRIKAPLKQDSRLPDDPQERAQLLEFNRQLVQSRQAAEWGMHSMRTSFGRLNIPLDVNDKEGRATLLEVCTRLHNLRAETVGINEIRQVYEPTWRTEEDDIFFRMERLVLRDVRRHDRVARFHRLTDV
ncbi:hypothetical protein PENSPDRAFT_617033 [Peniophora sp. CONT]|nr:hypothetical protein PENSPDRAFT_617033 [Peniophora sp. CONT]